MYFFLIGIATDKNGNDILDDAGRIVQSTYAISTDKEVARLALEVFRTHQTEDRSTYAPGTICSVADRAHLAETKEKLVLPPLNSTIVDDAASAAERIFNMVDV